MDLERLGRQFPTRLSFMRVLIRTMSAESWRIEREFFELDDDGAGSAVYRIETPNQDYRMCCSRITWILPCDRTG